MKEIIDHAIVDPLFQMFMVFMVCFLSLSFFIVGEWIKDKLKKK